MVSTPSTITPSNNGSNVAKSTTTTPTPSTPRFMQSTVAAKSRNYTGTIYEAVSVQSKNQKQHKRMQQKSPKEVSVLKVPPNSNGNVSENNSCSINNNSKITSNGGQQQHHTKVKSRKQQQEYNLIQYKRGDDEDEKKEKSFLDEQPLEVVAAVIKELQQEIKTVPSTSSSRLLRSSIQKKQKRLGTSVAARQKQQQHLQNDTTFSTDEYDISSAPLGQKVDNPMAVNAHRLHVMVATTSSVSTPLLSTSSTNDVSYTQALSFESLASSLGTSVTHCSNYNPGSSKVRISKQERGDSSNSKEPLPQSILSTQQVKHREQRQHHHNLHMDPADTTRPSSAPTNDVTTMLHRTTGSIQKQQTKKTKKTFQNIICNTNTNEIIDEHDDDPSPEQYTHGMNSRQSVTLETKGCAAIVQSCSKPAVQLQQDSISARTTKKIMQQNDRKLKTHQALIGIKSPPNQPLQQQQQVPQHNSQIQTGQKRPFSLDEVQHSQTVAVPDRKTQQKGGVQQRASSSEMDIRTSAKKKQERIVKRQGDEYGNRPVVVSSAHVESDANEFRFRALPMPDFTSKTPDTMFYETKSFVRSSNQKAKNHIQQVNENNVDFHGQDRNRPDNALLLQQHTTKGSSKMLTVPVPFKFHCDERVEQRKAFLQKLLSSKTTTNNENKISSTFSGKKMNSMAPSTTLSTSRTVEVTACRDGKNSSNRLLTASSSSKLAVPRKPQSTHKTQLRSKLLKKTPDNMALSTEVNARTAPAKLIATVSPYRVQPYVEVTKKTPKNLEELILATTKKSSALSKSRIAAAESAEKNSSALNSSFANENNLNRSLLFPQKNSYANKKFTPKHKLHYGSKYTPSEKATGSRLRDLGSSTKKTPEHSLSVSRYLFHDEVSPLSQDDTNTFVSEGERGEPLTPITPATNAITPRSKNTSLKSTRSIKSSKSRGGAATATPSPTVLIEEDFQYPPATNTSKWSFDPFMRGYSGQSVE